MTRDVRECVRGLIDKARRDRLYREALEGGYCLHCWAELPPAHPKTPKTAVRKFCSVSCRKRHANDLEYAKRAATGEERARTVWRESKRRRTNADTLAQRRENTRRWRERKTA